MGDMAWGTLWQEATKAVGYLMNAATEVSNKDKERMLASDKLRSETNLDTMKIAKNNTLPLIFIFVIILIMFAFLFFFKKDKK